MNTYKMTITQVVIVDAHNESDAVEFIDEALGEGDYAGYIVELMDIKGIQEV